MRAGIYGGISVRKNTMNIAIIEDTSHKELLKNTARKYFEMWNAQAQYYNESEKGRSG